MATRSDDAPAAGPAAFSDAYDRLLARWPVPVTALDLASAFGTTRVHACGPEDGAPVVLLAGGGATSTAWFGLVGDLAAGHRVYAVDPLGEPGRGVTGGRPIRSTADQLDWLATVLDGLTGPAGTVPHLVGHSHGGWLALHHALRRPDRVRSLALLDPTRCFAGLRPSYLLHALPLARPTADRQLALLRWEAGDVPLDPDWLALAALGADLPRSGFPVARRPPEARLRALALPTMVLLAEHSRAHDIGRVAAAATAALPNVRTAVLPGASHHSLPATVPPGLGERLLAFLG